MYAEILLFGRLSTQHQFFNYYVSHTSIGTQVRARFLKISSHSDYICRSKGVNVLKNGQKWTKTGYTNTFAPANPSRDSQIKFFF